MVVEYLSVHLSNYIKNLEGNTPIDDSDLTLGREEDQARGDFIFTRRITWVFHITWYCKINYIKILKSIIKIAKRSIQDYEIVSVWGLAELHEQEEYHWGLVRSSLQKSETWDVGRTGSLRINKLSQESKKEQD